MTQVNRTCREHGALLQQGDLPRIVWKQQPHPKPKTPTFPSPKPPLPLQIRDSTTRNFRTQNPLGDTLVPGLPDAIFSPW